MSDNVLKIFEGLTESQVKELRRRIIQALPELRREVTSAAKADTLNAANKSQNKLEVKTNENA